LSVVGTLCGLTQAQCAVVNRPFIGYLFQQWRVINVNLYLINEVVWELLNKLPLFTLLKIFHEDHPLFWSYSCFCNRLFGVALVNCIWFNLWIVGTSRHYYTQHVSSSYISALARSLLWTQLMHKAATVTFNNAHIARAMITTCRLMKTKRKRRKIPSSTQSAYMTKWKLKHTPPVIYHITKF